MLCLIPNLYIDLYFECGLFDHIDSLLFWDSVTKN